MGENRKGNDIIAQKLLTDDWLLITEKAYCLKNWQLIIRAFSDAIAKRGR